MPIVFRALSPPIGPALPPAAPVLSVGVVTSSSVALSWTAPPGALTYNVYQNGVRILTGVVGTSTTISGLTASTTYAFFVTAVNAVGEGAHSNTQNVTTSSGALPAMPLTYYNSASTDANQTTLLTTTAYINWLSNHNFVELPGYVGAQLSNGASLDSAMAAIKAHATVIGNPLCLTGKYFNSTRAFTTGNGTETGWTQAATDTLAAGCPFMLQVGTGPFPTGGNRVDGSNPFWVHNWSDASVPSTISSGASAWTLGLNCQQAAALYAWHTRINGTGSAVNQSNIGSSFASPNTDFLFWDNFTWAPNFSGQWACDSTTYPNEFGTANPPVRAQSGQNGLAQGLAKFRSLGLPAGRTQRILIIANASFANWQSANGQGPTVYPSCQGIIDGPFAESQMGSLIQATHNFQSPDRMFSGMQIQEQTRSNDPQAVPIFNTEGGGPYVGTTWPASQANWGTAITGVTHTIQTNFNQGVATNATVASKTPTGTYWQAARYGFGFACMRQWVYYIDNKPFISGAGTCWLDEYNQGKGIGGGGNNWFGQVAQLSPSTRTLPISGGQLNGVYRFVYPNCTVYFNPVGNGIINYTLQAGDMKNMIPKGPLNDGVNYIVGGVLTLQDADCRVVTP